MKRLLITLALAGTFAASSAPAQASLINECGRANAWTVNVTTRNLNCQAARRMARSIGFIPWRTGAFRTTFRRGYPFSGRITYTCRVRKLSGWWLDVRCTNWIYVFRYQYMTGE